MMTRIAVEKNKLIMLMMKRMQLMDRVVVV